MLSMHPPDSSSSDVTGFILLEINSLEHIADERLWGETMFLFDGLVQVAAHLKIDLAVPSLSDPFTRMTRSLDLMAASDLQSRASISMLSVHPPSSSLPDATGFIVLEIISLVHMVDERLCGERFLGEVLFIFMGR
jgi:hypothetical protein